MKKLLTLVVNLLTTCGICHGMGTVETGSSGDTKECRACSGKGYR